MTSAMGTTICGSSSRGVSQQRSHAEQQRNHGEQNRHVAAQEDVDKVRQEWRLGWIESE